MSDFTDDERDWIQRFQHHLDEYVSPRPHPTPTSCSISDNNYTHPPCTLQAKHVLESINSHFAAAASILHHCQTTRLRVPVEYDILSVEFLKTKFTSSFQVEISLVMTLDKTNESATPPMEEDETPRDRYSVSKPLHEVPVVLVGRLKSSCSSSVAMSDGGLVLQDLTGEIECEVCHQALPDHDCINQFVVLLKWNYIHSTSSTYKSYLEVQELVVVDSAQNMLCLPSASQLPQSANVHSVASLKDHMSQNILPKKAMLNVCGKVTALSEVYKGQYFFVKISNETNDSHLQHNIIIENHNLFHFCRLVKLQGFYVFTNLQDKAIKGSGFANVERVLASTKETHILSYQFAPADYSVSSSPPKKRRRTTDTSSPALDTHHCNLTDTVKCSAKTNDNPICKRPLQEPLISYRGVVTKCVLPEAGLYELDGRVRLYLTKRESTNLCRGLRCGATLELHNVHLLKLSSPELKHASGFCCCALSSVQIVQFSTYDTPFKAFISRNKLASLAKKYRFMDTAWILETYLFLVKNDASHDLKNRFAVLKELCKMAALSPIKLDPHTQFLSNPHCCKPMEPVDLSERPSVCNLGHFLEEVDKKLNSKGFQWYGRSQEDSAPTTEASPFVVFAVCAQWSFGIIKSSEVLHKSVLVGTLRASDTTGDMELVDETGSIPLVCSIPLSSLPPLFQTAQSARHFLLGGFECKVLVTDSCVFVERSTESHVQPQAPKNFPYLLIKQCIVVSTACKEDDATSTKHTDASRVTNEEQCLYFVILNKNVIFQRPSFATQLQQKCSSFSAQALVHTNADILKRSKEEGLHQPLVHAALNFPLHFYSFINNGCLYSLSLKPSQPASCSEKEANSSSKLPSLKSLSDEPYIDVTSEFKVEFLSFPSPTKKTPLDVTDLISKVFLPKFLTVTSSTKESSRYDGEIVTLRGLVLKHSYRIDHVSTMAGTVASMSGKSSSPSRIIALTVRSVDCPDTIMVYCEYREGVPLPLGLLPGATVTFNSFKLKKSSKSGNVYCTSTAASSIVVNCLDGVEALCNSVINMGSSVVTQEMLNLPTTYLSSMMNNLLRGSLPGRIVCIVGKFMQVVRLSVQYMCLGCQSTAVNGSCMTACLKRRHVLKAEGRIIVEDGSGEGHVYVNDAVLREALGVCVTEWGELCDIVEQIGQVVYSGKSSFEKLQAAETTNRFSLVNKAKEKISHFVSQPTFHRTVKLFCQPFVSQPELNECVIGQKCHTLRQYNTLALPRLQLRAVALVDMNKSHVIVRECEQLLKLLNT